MIAYKDLASRERLGNQLFRYAFLRSMARRLGVKFYCPDWTGDKIFQLNDQLERAKDLTGIKKAYVQSKGSPCYSKTALDIQDNTKISGYFQTEKYYQDKEAVREWFTFKDDVISSVKAKYGNIEFSRSVGLHLRLGDWVAPRGKVYHRYIPRWEYYQRALLHVKHNDNILIFSDEIDKAREYFRFLKGNVIYMSGNKPYEDLYLMSRCQDFISSPSTLSWWGAWLNTNRDKIIIVPKEGPLRFSRQKVKDYWPKGYIKIRALRPVLDSYNLLSIYTFILNFVKRFKQILERKLSG